ncbi:MAG: OmpA family protein [Myxococcales bacterium]|nr:OmpA family protein [Myxococcales bacterium]
MIEEPEGLDGSVWMTFADLMSGLLGVFVLLVVWIVVFQVDLAQRLDVAREASAEATALAARAEAARQVEAEQRMILEAEQQKTRARMADLESVLAGSIAAGRITLAEDGRIGIAGNVLFDLYSDELRPEGRQVLADLAVPLARWLEARDELVMVGGFTDDLPIRGDRYRDNWELSAKRALTVVRTLAADGVPASRLFAAGFGDSHPAVPNVDEASRARNRRVEIVPQRRER